MVLLYEYNIISYQSGTTQSCIDCVWGVMALLKSMLFNNEIYNALDSELPDESFIMKPNEDCAWSSHAAQGRVLLIEIALKCDPIPPHCAFVEVSTNVGCFQTFFLAGFCVCYQDGSIKHSREFRSGGSGVSSTQ